MGGSCPTGVVVQHSIERALSVAISSIAEPLFILSPQAENKASRAESTGRKGEGFLWIGSFTCVRENLLFLAEPLKLSQDLFGLIFQCLRPCLATHDFAILATGLVPPGKKGPRVSAEKPQAAEFGKQGVHCVASLWE
jgi:hypothetical protein